MGLFDRLMQAQAPRRNLMDTQMVRRPSESYLRQDYPGLYGALGGLLGTAPDVMEGSVLDPSTAAVRRGAEYTFPVGTALGMLPAARFTKGLPVGMGIKDVSESPFVVYRGGIKGKAIATEGLQPGSVQLGQGAYFGSSKGMAEEFAKYRPEGVVEAYHLNLKTPFDETAKIIPSTEQMQALRKNLLDIGVPKIYVDELEQPYRGAITNLSDAFSKKLTRQGKPTTNWQAADKINAAIRKSGFDGIIADVPEGGEQYVAFSKNQFKPLSKLSQESTYHQQAALDLAKQRAALPIEQGGLGLPAGNTAEQRAAAMGGKDMVHFSRAGGDYTTLDSGKFAIAPFDAVGTHVGTPQAAMERFQNTVGYKVNNPNYANDELRGASYPVTILGDRPLMNQNGMPWGEDDLNAFLRKEGGHNWSDIKGGAMTYQDMNANLRKKLFEKQGYTSIPYYNEVEGKGSISYIVPPENIRSRFAAFDPFRRSAAIAATMGVAAPDLLANELDYPSNPMYTDPLGYSIR